jgi:hypothetical protein
MKKLLVLGLVAVSTLMASSKPVHAGTAGRGMVYSADGYANVRSAPNAKILRRCPNGSVVFTETGYYYKGWLRIFSDRCGDGYMHESQLVYPEANVQFISRDGYTNVRSTPNGRIIGQIATGRTAEVYLRKGEWLMIVSDDYSISGWVHQSQVE